MKSIRTISDFERYKKAEEILLTKIKADFSTIP